MTGKTKVVKNGIEYRISDKEH